MTDYILKDWDGNIFISIEKECEEKLIDYSELTHCLAVVKVENDYLLGWNKWRNRWEIFGGCIDKGEIPRDCIIREYYEELGIENKPFEYLGMMKFLMMPDYFSSEERIEYGGLYGVTLENMSIEEINQQINDRDEIVKAIPNKERLKPLHRICLHIFRHLAQKILDRRQPACGFFVQSDEKSDCASSAQSLFGIALSLHFTKMLKTKSRLPLLMRNYWNIICEVKL